MVAAAAEPVGPPDLPHVEAQPEPLRQRIHEARQVARRRIVLAALAAQIRSFGGENDSPSRNLSRFLDSLADRLKIGLDVRQVWRNDRFGRGGDHTEFLNAGFPAVRFSVAIENYDEQHQDLRNESGKDYGDTVDKMDFAYLAKVTKLNIAALAALASAPPPPEDVVAEGAVSTALTGEYRVRLGSVVDRESVGRQLARLELPCCDEFEEGLHVALLCPADIGRREVVPALLVVAIVSARTI